MSQAPFASKVIFGPLREALLLERALRSVETRSADQVVRIRELATAVDVRLAAAQPLAPGDQVAPALVILREAAQLAALAVLAARNAEGAERSGEDALERVAQLANDGNLTDAPLGFASVCKLLSSANRLVFDEMAPTDAANRRLEVEKSIRWMRDLVEPRSAAQIKLSRTLRLVSAVLLVLGAFGGLLGWGALKIFSAINIAHGKTVQLSSRRPACGTTNPEGLPPSGLVDGSKSGGYDICTNSEVGPWATVDLGKVFTLSKAKVYGRDDCCWGLYDLPTVFEISLDGTDYTEVARQTTSYSAIKPWNVTIGGRPARFVRLRVDSREARELVLSELEVFGRSQ